MGKLTIKHVEPVRHVRVLSTVQIIFVADFDKLDGERVLVTERNAQGAIGRRRVAHQELELVEGILDIGRKLLLGENGAVEVQTAPNSKHGLDSKVLAPKQVFYQTLAISVLVAPGTRAPRSLGQIANGQVPRPVVRRTVSLEIVTARDTKVLGVERGQGFHQVFAVTVGCVVVGGRKQADEVEVEFIAGRGVEGQDKAVVAVGCAGRGRQGEAVLCPVSCHRRRRNSDRGQRLVGNVGD